MNSVMLAGLHGRFSLPTPHTGNPTTQEREDLPVSEDQEQSSPTPTRAR